MSDKKIYAVKVEQCTDFYVYVEAESTWDAERVAEHSLAAEKSPLGLAHAVPSLMVRVLSTATSLASANPKQSTLLRGRKVNPLILLTPLSLPI